MPNLVVISGPNGSGKSTTAPKLLRDTMRVRQGGHDVPEAIVRRRYTRSLSNFYNIYRPIANSWLMPDNSAADAPKPVAWRNAGGPVQIVKNGPWSRLQKEYEKDIFEAR